MAEENDRMFYILRHFPELKQSFLALEQSHEQSRSKSGVQSSSVLKSSLRYHSQKIPPPATTTPESHSTSFKLRQYSKSSLDSVPGLARKSWLEARVKFLDDETLSHSTRVFLSSPPPQSPNISSFNKQNASVSGREAYVLLARHALNFDLSPLGNPLFHGFRSSYRDQGLSQTDFHQCLKKFLEFWISKEETDQLFDYLLAHFPDMKYPEDKIDATKFLRHFTDLNDKERRSLNKNTKKLKCKERNESIERERKRLEEQKMWEADQVSTTAPEQAFERVSNKLKQIAFLFDPYQFINAKVLTVLRGFLTGISFKEAIERCFLIKVSPAEAGALINKFTTREGEHCVDGEKFLNYFHQLHEEAWREHKQANEVLIQRHEKIRAMGQQDVDYLPKVLGR